MGQDKVKKPITKKQKNQDKLQELASLKKRLQQLEAEKRKLPSRSAGSWTAPIGTQVSQVRHHFYTHAQNEVQVGKRSHPILIEALQGVIADLQLDALNYREAQRAPPVRVAPQQLQAPPVAAVQPLQPEARTKFWKLPAKLVATGMTALKKHMDCVDLTHHD